MGLRIERRRREDDARSGTRCEKVGCGFRPTRGFAACRHHISQWLDNARPIDVVVRHLEHVAVVLTAAGDRAELRLTVSGWTFYRHRVTYDEWVQCSQRLQLAGRPAWLRMPAPDHDGNREATGS